jgi:hypothetical protein
MKFSHAGNTELEIVKWETDRVYDSNSRMTRTVECKMNAIDTKLVEVRGVEDVQPAGCRLTTSRLLNIQCSGLKSSSRGIQGSMPTTCISDGLVRLPLGNPGCFGVRRLLDWRTIALKIRISRAR